ncbi:MAG: thiosulfohydrolase SoxB, partial [Burkholderiaceae bacterium]
MSLNRREFMGVMAAATASGMFGSWQDANAAAAKGEKLYEIPKFGNVSFLHFTDCHAQLLPVYFREPSVNLGLAEMLGRPPHFVGEALL